MFIKKTKDFIVRDSRISISVYHVIDESTERIRINKILLKYKFAITVGKDGNNIRFVSLAEDNTLSLEGVSEFYLFFSSKEKRTTPHSNEELTIILRSIVGLPTKYLGLMESLFLATRDDDFISDFNRAYGEEQFKALKEKLELCIKNSQGNYNLNIVARRSKYPTIFSSCSNLTYSVFDLLYDLASDHAEISIEGFVRVTGSATKKPDNVEYDKCPWKTVISVLGNKQRANLSLVYRTFVNVDIPENEFGIDKEAGQNLTCVRTINIISDGVLTVPKLRVRVTNPSIKKRLVANRILHGDEVDLTSLPIIGRTKIGRLHANQIAMTKVGEFVSKIAVLYYEALSKKMQPEFDPKKAFLESFGIYPGKKYIPVNEYSIITDLAKKSSTALVTYINNVPSNTKDIVASIEEYIKTGEVGQHLSKNKGSQLKWILEKIQGQNHDLEYWSKKYHAYSDSLKKLVFRMIMSKTVNFKGDYKSPYIEDIECKIPILGDPSYKALVKWKLRNVNIQ